MATELKLPELAEGISKGDVVSILVKEGDTVDADTSLIEVESEKATLPVPANVKGTVSKILVKTGQKINVGDPFIVIDEEGGEAAPAASEKKEKAEAKPKAATSKSKESSGEGDRSPKERVESTDEPPPAPKPRPASPAPMSGGEHLPAGPAVRRIARELGIDLGVVQGSGRNGRIVVEDLDPYIRGYINQRGGGAVGSGVAPIELPDFTKFGTVRREKAESLRRKIAERMQQSWTTVPHVHQFADADITELLGLMKRYKEKSKEAGAPLTLTVFALKAVALALKEFPQFNATYDVAQQEFVYKEYINIGVAVDTPAGLIVPVIRDVDKKPLMQLSKELSDLAQRTRDRKTSLDDLRGGSFTISNLGGIGGTHFTPIVNVPEVAILGIGRSKKTPVFDKSGNVVARDICPICVGYDHRVIDGADGARFAVRLTEILENFEAAFLGF